MLRLGLDSGGDVVADRVVVASVNEMVEKTATPHAPWNLVPSVCKQYVRIRTLDIPIDRVRKAVKGNFVAELKTGSGTCRRISATRFGQLTFSRFIKFVPERRFERLLERGHSSGRELIFDESHVAQIEWHILENLCD